MNPTALMARLLDRYVADGHKRRDNRKDGLQDRGPSISDLNPFTYRRPRPASSLKRDRPPRPSRE
jgi:hypothetical protein